MIRTVLDTDVFSYLYRNLPQAARFLPRLKGVIGALAFPTVAELHFGARQARWGDAEIRRLEDEIALLVVLPFDAELPALCGQLRAEAARTGHPLGQRVHANDLWIATCAVYYEVPLLTGNARHFQGLPGLELVET